MTATLTLVKIEDHEGDGRCSACQREGLRWICTLSDGTTVGTECAKTVIGFKPAPRSYVWAEHFTATVEHTEGGDTFVLWRSKGGAATRETRNGVLSSVGGAERTWKTRGWI